MLKLIGSYSQTNSVAERHLIPKTMHEVILSLTSQAKYCSPYGYCNLFMTLGNIFHMKISFFGEMHSFPSFLSNEPLKIVEIFSITTKKGDTVFTNAVHQTTFPNSISKQQNLDVLLSVDVWPGFNICVCFSVISPPQTREFSPLKQRL